MNANFSDHPHYFDYGETPRLDGLPSFLQISHQTTQLQMVLIIKKTCLDTSTLLDLSGFLYSLWLYTGFWLPLL